MPTTAHARPDPRRLPGSKWSAETPVDRDKHFTVVRLCKDPEAPRRIVAVELQALLSKRNRTVSLEVLSDPEQWRPGWR